MRILEKTLVVLAVMAVILRFNAIPGGAILTAFSVLVLSCLYQFFGFALFNGIRARKIFKSASYHGVTGANIAFAIISGMILSVGCFAILFSLMHWAGGGILVNSSFVCLLSISIVSVILTVNKSVAGKNVLWRVVPMLLLDVFFLLKYYFMF